jgi:hypothetical protein
MARLALISTPGAWSLEATRQSTCRVSRGCATGRYFQGSPTGLCASAEHQADQRADKAIQWIRGHGVCTGRDLQRHRVAGLTRASQADKLLRDLVDLGQGELRERRLPSGRTQRVFVMHTDASSSGASCI